MKLFFSQTLKLLALHKFKLLPLDKDRGKAHMSTFLKKN